MPQDDELQVAVFYKRPPLMAQGALPVEMGGGEGNLIKIRACHWNYDIIQASATHIIFIGVALSSNPEHAVKPLIDFVDFQRNKALYARALIISNHFGTGDSTITTNQQIIPCYDLIRPRRQIMVWSTLSPEEDVIGLGLEIYYRTMGAPLTEREEVNRKYGKYRRT